MNITRALRMLYFESAAEFLKAWRLPSFVLPSLLFPIGFFVLFGLLIPSSTGQQSAAEFYLINFGIFAAMGPAMFGFGIGVATERVEGWLALKRLTPVPSWIFLSSKLLMAAAFTTIVLIVLYALAAYAGGARFERWQWLALAAVHLVTVPPMGLLGLAVGLRFRPQSAAGIINIVFLGMAALGGLWLPMSILPPFIQQGANVLPTRHLSQLAMYAAGVDRDVNPLTHLAVTVAFTALFGLMAAWAWRRAMED